MKRNRIHRTVSTWLAVCLALVGMLASSTVTVWAAACDGDCDPPSTQAQQADAAPMSCHGPEAADESPSSPQIGRASCCVVGHAVACRAAEHYGPGPTLLVAAERCDRDPAVIAPTIDVIATKLAALAAMCHRARWAPKRALERPLALTALRTVVLLL